MARCVRAAETALPPAGGRANPGAYFALAVDSNRVAASRSAATNAEASPTVPPPGGAPPTHLPHAGRWREAGARPRDARPVWARSYLPHRRQLAQARASFSADGRKDVAKLTTFATSTIRVLGQPLTSTVGWLKKQL